MRKLVPLLLLTGACGGNAAASGAAVGPASNAESLSASSLDSLWASANAALRHGHWSDALARAERFMLEAPRTDDRRVDALMLTAEAKLAGGQRLEAARTFRRVSDETPSHPLAPVALLRVADAYSELWRRPELDPTYGQSALATYQELLNRYPGTDAARRAQLKITELNDHFAEKLYSAARYYLRLRAYDSAIIYLKDLLATYPRAEIASTAVLDLIQTYSTLGYVEDASETCGYLRRFHPGTPGTYRSCPPEAAQGP